MVNRRRTGCWLRASGVQRAVLAGVVLWSSRSIIDRQIGFGGLSGACVVVGEVIGRGNGVRGYQVGLLLAVASSLSSLVVSSPWAEEADPSCQSWS